MDTIKYCEFKCNCDSCGRSIKRDLQFVEGKPSVELVNQWWCSNGLCNAYYALHYKAHETVRGNVHIDIDKFFSSAKKRKNRKMVLPIVKT